MMTSSSKLLLGLNRVSWESSVGLIWCSAIQGEISILFCILPVRSSIWDSEFTHVLLAGVFLTSVETSSFVCICIWQEFFYSNLYRKAECAGRDHPAIHVGEPVSIEPVVAAETLAEPWPSMRAPVEGQQLTPLGTLDKLQNQSIFCSAWVILQQ